MCRNFDVFLSPIKCQDIFFEKGIEGNQYLVRPREAILSDLRRRIELARSIAEDCSKKSTKAGYDAGGMAVGFISLDSILTFLDRRREQATVFSSKEVAELTTDFRDQLLTYVKVARDGGDLLKIWDTLESRLGLRDVDFITNWETHVRQASQGDMYTESNAHPHQEMLVNDKVCIYKIMASGEITHSRHERMWGPSIFSDTHNGDINDASRYKRFLNNEGFRFISNSDSCVEPALKRFIYEHLCVGELAGVLHRLTYMDPDFINNHFAEVDKNGYVGTHHYLVGSKWSGKTLAIAIEGSHISFWDEGQLVGNFTQRGFLCDDEQSLADDKIADLLALARKMSEQGAKKVTIAAAIVARILEYSHPKNKFVFQSFTPLGKPDEGFLGGGTYTTVRGGTEKGGEEGGEIIFHIPKSYDQRNYKRIAFMSASEENALKGQVALLDPVALTQGHTRMAPTEVLEITSLPNIRATAYITEGVLPIFDVLPGEIVEVTANGRVKLYNIYGGHAISLLTLDGYDLDTGKWAGEPQRHNNRRERLAPLKIFNIEYRNLEDQLIPCPYNKYGEEIIVIQPLALRRNTLRLFTIAEDGVVRLRIGDEGIGLTMGTDDITLRHERIKQLTHVITGAAGTSFLINTIASNVARKLGLNTLPIINFDGFTGSDTIPPYVGEHTLFLANSNSGGTSDTIKLTHQMASLSGVLSRIEVETLRRDASISEVQEALSLLSEIQAALKVGTDWEDLTQQQQDFLAQKTPLVYVITNIEASALGNIGRGLDPIVRSAVGAGITNLPEEECVGSTFAAMASLQWQIAFYTYLGEARGDISSAYAAEVYSDLARLPEVAEKIVSNAALAGEIECMCDELTGGNFDFVYTGYLDGVPEEQAHKAAEMIQEMFAGWHFFQFQHGKYAHMKRRTRHTLGSILGHNAPPPSWSFFNARALKSPSEIGPRVATSFVIAHESDREAFLTIPDYRPDFVYTYPADSIALYPFQVIMISHLISYFWGLKKKEISEKVKYWNEPFVNFLLQTPSNSLTLTDQLRSPIEMHARHVLKDFLFFCDTTPRFDNIGGRRKTAIINALSLLTGEDQTRTHQYTYVTGGFLGSEIQHIALPGNLHSGKPIDNVTYLSVLKDLAIELSNVEQAKRLADHFLVDDMGNSIPRQITVARPHNQTRIVYEYDYLIEYEGLGTFYDVEPVHPPKVAKAKKGWL